MKRIMKIGAPDISALLIVALGVFLFLSEKDEVNAATVTGNKVSDVISCH